MPRFYIVEQNALDIGGHYYSYTKTIANTAVEHGFEVIVLSNQNFKGDYTNEAIKIVPTFHYTWLQAMWQPPKVWRSGMFSFDLVNALSETDVQDGDIIFIHTIGNEELITLLAYLSDLPPSLSGCFFHVLLRYDPIGLSQKIALFEPLFSKIRHARHLRERVIFHSDTKELATRFQRITGLPFSVAPIPFDTETLSNRLEKCKEANIITDNLQKRIRIAYVGDARREKNYQHLPKAIEYVLSQDTSAAKQLEFQIQSNFNIPNGEEGIADALAHLEALDNDRVKLTYTQLDTLEYLDQIAQADAIYVAYDTKHYHLRSSGVLIEAMAAGKPVIVSAPSWMASQVDASHAVVLNDINQLGDAFLDLSKHYKALKKGAEKKAVSVLEKASGQAFISYLTHHTPPFLPSSDVNKEHILIIAEGGQYRYPNGARKVVDQQLSFLDRAGYKISILFVFSTPMRIEDRPTVINHLKQSISQYQINRSFFTFKSSSASDTTRSRLGDFWQGIKYSIKFDLRQSMEIDLPYDLLHFLRTETVDKILLNYITRYPIIETIGLTNVPVICEIHDIQSKQRAIYGRRSFGTRDWELERHYLDKCDVLISLNQSETDFLQKELPNKQIFTTGYFKEGSRNSIEQLLGIGSIRELIASSNPNNLALQSYKNDLEGITKTDAVLDSSKIDLIFVSSNHRPNQDGLRKFMHECYEPFLKDRNISLLIIGSIDYEAIAKDLPDLPNVKAIGSVDNLSPLYAASRIVILPIWDGAGLAIKTIEALSEGKPIVAAEKAMRGISNIGCSDTIVQEPSDMAIKILELLSDEERRLKASNHAKKTFNLICDPNRYDTIMNEIFKSHNTLQKQSIQMKEMPFLCELTPSILQVNRLIMAWINGHYFEQDIPLNNYKTAQIEALINAYKSLLAGKINVWELPIFKANPEKAIAVLNRQNNPNTLEKFDAFTKSILMS